MNEELNSYKVLDNIAELPQGRVMTVTADHTSICLTHYNGKISKEQRAAEVDVWHTTLHNPSFAKYAENCGALGIRVTQLDELEGALEKIKNHNGPALLEVITDVNLI